MVGILPITCLVQEVKMFKDPFCSGFNCTKFSQILELDNKCILYILDVRFKYKVSENYNIKLSVPYILHQTLILIKRYAYVRRIKPVIHKVTEMAQ